jgi:hypothetical protein
VCKRIAKWFTVTVAAVGALTLAAAPAGAATTTFYLNSYDPSDASIAFCSGANLLPAVTPPGCGGSVTAPVVLANGSTYTVSVVGAVSAWGSWPYRRCGKPEPSSEFASPGIANRPAGDDAQFRFAIPLYTGKCVIAPKKSKLKKTTFFQVDLGSGWLHPVADGDPKKPSDDNDKADDQHPYTFTFTGQGVAPQFRFIDYHPSDNSGRFRIVITG